MFILKLSLTIFVSFSAYAQGENNNSVIQNKDFQKISFNEYEYLKQLNEEYVEAKQNDTLDSHEYFKNLTEEELHIIENYKQEYSDKIYELKEWKIEELKNVNYNEEQIKAIKTFDGSEEKLILAGTTVTVEVGFVNLNYSSSGTTVDLIAAFNSEGIQSNWFKDIFAVVWSSPLTVVFESGHLRYDTKFGQTVTLDQDLSSGLYNRDMDFYKYHDGPGTDTYYLHSGSIIISLSSNTTVLDLATHAAYGYTTLNITPSVTYPGGISIVFSSGTEKVAEDYDAI